MSSSNRDSSTPKPASSPDDSCADVTAAVDDLLNNLMNKFAEVSSEIFAKMDDMTRRLDVMEAALLENKGKEGGPPKQ